jgi:MFS family permease
MNSLKAASFGPILGPIISGCSVPYGWRWAFRIDLILTGTTWLALLFTSGMIPQYILDIVFKQID